MSNNETQAERHVFLGLIAVTTKTLRTGKRTVIRMYKQTYRLCVSVCLSPIQTFEPDKTWYGHYVIAAHPNAARSNFL